MKCVTESYFLERFQRHRKEIGRKVFSTGSNIGPPHVHRISSGLAAGSVVYRLPEESDIAPDVPIPVWLDSGDEGFFDAATPSQDYRVSTSRPLIERIYNFYFNHRGSFYSLCDGFTFRFQWTVTVTAPDGVLHELFFDPVTVGSAVAADGANGVLKPALFAGANGATTTIERIAWEPGSGATGTVKVALSPHTRSRGPCRGLHRPGRLRVPVPGRGGRHCGCGQQHAELACGVPAVAERRRVDGAHSGGAELMDVRRPA